MAKLTEEQKLQIDKIFIDIAKKSRRAYAKSDHFRDLNKYISDYANKTHEYFDNFKSTIPFYLDLNFKHLYIILDIIKSLLVFLSSLLIATVSLDLEKITFFNPRILLSVSAVGIVILIIIAIIIFYIINKEKNKLVKRVNSVDGLYNNLYEMHLSILEINNPDRINKSNEKFMNEFTESREFKQIIESIVSNYEALDTEIKTFDVFIKELKLEAEKIINNLPHE